LPFLFKGGYLPYLSLYFSKTLFCLLDRKTGKPLKSGETTHGESRYGPGKQKRYTDTELDNMSENGAKYKQVETGTKKLE
jgi:hypothetical protein